MKAPAGEIRLANTAGHTCVIGAEYTEVPEMFRRMAVAEGALIEGVQPEAPPPPKVEHSKEELVAKAMRDMMDVQNPDDFGQDGKPKVDAVSARAGFTVDRHTRDSVWRKVAG
jgi:hypothetical protein